MKKLFTFIILHLFIYNLNNAFAQCTNPTLSLNLPDTTIAFKEDSVLLDAGAGYTTYSWNTGATTRFVWAKFHMKYKVTVTSGNNCGSDSTVVMLLKGIQQKDTTICSSSSINLSVPDYIPTNGLVGWWPFNGNANDFSGNGNNATSNSAILTTDRFGKLNSAISTSDGYVIAGKQGVPTNGPISISFWMNQQSDFGIGEAINLGSPFNSQWGVPAANNRLCVNYGRGCGSTGSTQLPSPITTGNWHHVLYVSNGKGTFSKVYLDGVYIGQSTNANSNGQCLGMNLVFGADRYLNANFNGKLDDIAIWNRTLSPQEAYDVFKQNGIAKKRWSTNDTTNSIIVSPNSNTTYYCDITVGSYSFRDSVRVSVNAAPNINLGDTLIAFNVDSILLDAGAGHSKYLWSNGHTTQTIWAKNTSVYKVTVQNSAGCSAGDSTQVLFVKGIRQKDTSICTGSSINLSIPGSIPTNGLVGWWPFNGNANDLSGNGNNATSNSATLTTDRFGKLQSAISTSNGYVIAGKQGVPTNGPVSISFWMNQQSNFGIGEVINLGSESNTQWGALAANNSLCMNYGRGCGSTGSTQLSSLITSGNWYHILYVSNGTGTSSKVYLNGVYIGQSTNASTSGQCSSSQLVFGADRFANSNFNGKLDDIAIWNRTLSPQEVYSVFNQNGIAKLKWSTNDTTNSITVSPNTSTTYYYDITVGSYTFKDSVRINVRAFPNKSVNYAKLGLCKNDTIAFSANTGYSYNWFKNDSIVGSLQTLKVAEQGSYYVTLTDSFGCKNTSDTLRVFNAPLPNVQFIINDTAHCVKENMFSFKDSTLLDSGTYNRLWNFGSSNTSTQMEPTFNFAAVGTYPIKLQVNTNYGCKDSLTKTVTVLPNPTAGPMLGATTALSVATPYVYTVAQQPNHTYNWVVSNGIIAAGQGTNAATVQWLNNGKGYLKVDVTNTQGCKDTTATQVTIGNVGLHEAGNINSLMVYPNPSNGTFVVSFNALKSSTVEMSLVNLLGQQIWNTQHTIQAGEQSIQINANLSPGVYTLSINNQNEQVQHKVMIK